MLMYSPVNAAFSPSGQRLRMIKALLDAGLASIEVGSFVSPQAVPAMAGVANG